MLRRIRSLEVLFAAWIESADGSRRRRGGRADLPRKRAHVSGTKGIALGPAACAARRTRTSRPATRRGAAGPTSTRISFWRGWRSCGTHGRAEILFAAKSYTAPIRIVAAASRPTRLHEISTSWPRRRRDPVLRGIPPRNNAAASQVRRDASGDAHRLARLLVELPEALPAPDGRVEVPGLRAAARRQRGADARLPQLRREKALQLVAEVEPGALVRAHVLQRLRGLWGVAVFVRMSGVDLRRRFWQRVAGSAEGARIYLRLGCRSGQRRGRDDVRRGSTVRVRPRRFPETRARVRRARAIARDVLPPRGHLQTGRGAAAAATRIFRRKTTRPAQVRVRVGRAAAGLRRLASLEAGAGRPRERRPSRRVLRRRRRLLGRAHLGAAGRRRDGAAPTRGRCAVGCIFRAPFSRRGNRKKPRRRLRGDGPAPPKISPLIFCWPQVWSRGSRARSP